MQMVSPTMRGVYLILVSALAYPVIANSDDIKSTDQLELTYKPSEDHPLFGNPGSTTELHFQVKNNGEDSRFAISKSCSTNPQLCGESISEVFVKSGTIEPIHIENIQIPDLPGTKLTIDVKLTRIDESITNTADFVKRSVIFTIGETASEQEPPQIQQEYRPTDPECKVEDDETACDNSRWNAEFTVRDHGVGLQSLDIQAMGKYSYDHPLFFKHHNFAIGSTEDVTVITKVSCCVQGVSVTATDIKGNQITRDFTSMGNGSNSVPITCAAACLLVIINIFNNL